MIDGRGDEEIFVRTCEYESSNGDGIIFHLESSD